MIPARAVREVGRWRFEVNLDEIPVPRARVVADGEDYAYVVVEVARWASDPVVGVVVDLEGTRAGRAVCSAFFWWRRRRGR